VFRLCEGLAATSLRPLCNKDRNPPGGALLVFRVRRIRRNGKLPEPRPIRRECVDHVIVLGEAHLRRILTKYAAYHDELRTHRCLDKDAPIHRAIRSTFRRSRSAKAQAALLLQPQGRQATDAGGHLGDCRVQGDSRIAFAILTDEPNEVVASYHDRMPLALADDKVATWLDLSQEFSTSSRRLNLNRLAINVPSRWRMASIASDDALILPHRANSLLALLGHLPVALFFPVRAARPCHILEPSNDCDIELAWRC
jgi:hypothetical protein